MAWKILKGLLWTEDFPKVFYGSKIFQKSSMDIQVFYSPNIFYRSSTPQIPFTGLLWTEDLSMVFYGQKESFTVLYTPKSFNRSIDWRLFKGFYGPKRFYRTAFMTQYLLEVFCGPKTFQRSFMPQRPFRSHLWTEFLLNVFYGPKTFYSSLWPNGRSQGFCRVKSFYRSSTAQTHFTVLLWTKDLSTSSMTLWPFAGLIILQVVYCSKIFYGFSLDPNLLRVF